MVEYTGFHEIDEAASNYVNWVDDLTGREKSVEEINEEASVIAFAMVDLLGRGKYLFGYDTGSFVEGVVGYALGESAGVLPDDVLARLEKSVSDSICEISYRDEWRGERGLDSVGGDS